MIMMTMDVLKSMERKKKMWKNKKIKKISHNNNEDDLTSIYYGGGSDLTLMMFQIGAYFLWLLLSEFVNCRGIFGRKKIFALY